MMRPLSLKKVDSARRRALVASLRALAWGLSAKAGLVLTGCQRAEVTSIQALPAAQRQAPPDFSYTLLDGQQQDSSALKGRVTLVTFWATTCAVCVAEMPFLVTTQQQFGTAGYGTLAVAMPYDPPALVADFAQRRQLPFGVVIDPSGSVVQAFGDVRGTPSHFVLDRQGRVAAQFQGAVTAQALHPLIAGLLAET
jgi:peroxiredoxin